MLAAGACHGSPVAPDARPLVDVDAVAAEFRPTTTTVGAMVGVAYQLPAGGTPADDAVRAFALSALQQAGIHHARADLLWDVVEPTRGAFDFSSYHAKVDGFTSAGVTALPILCYGNPWANAMPGSDTVPPDDPADFATYAGTAATEFRAALPAYEIWNEENLGFRFWQPREQPDAYGELLADASAKVRAADPGAKVVLGGLIDHGLINKDAETFLQLLYRAHPQIGAAYDVLAFHPYMEYPPAIAPEVDDAANDEVAVARMVAQLRAVLAYYGDDPNRPIWATEIGWPTYKTVDEELQARWLVRSLLLLAGAGVERVYWYTLFDGPNPTAYPPEDAFGLFHYDDPGDGTFAPTPKLAWTALSNLIATASTLAVTADVSAQLAGAPPDAHAYVLSDPSGASARRVTVVWRTDDAAPPVMIAVPVGQGPLQVVDLVGQPLAASATVPLSGRPVYVIEN